MKNKNRCRCRPGAGAVVLGKKNRGSGAIVNERRLFVLRLLEVWSDLVSDVFRKWAVLGMCQ